VCYYITMALPGQAQLAALAPVAQRHAIALQPIKNASVRRHLAAGDQYLLTTTSFCDCATSLGDDRRGPSRKGDETLLCKIEKLMRKGWSQTKVDRWLAEKRKTRLRDERNYKEHLAASADDAERWLAGLREILSTGGAPWVALLLHWYDGGVDREIIQVKRVEAVRLAETTRATLTGLEEDVLYRFHGPAGRAGR